MSTSRSIQSWGRSLTKKFVMTTGVIDVWFSVIELRTCLFWVTSCLKGQTILQCRVKIRITHPSFHHSPVFVLSFAWCRICKHALPVIHMVDYVYMNIHWHVYVYHVIAFWAFLVSSKFLMKVKIAYSICYAMGFFGGCDVQSFYEVARWDGVV